MTWADGANLFAAEGRIFGIAVVTVSVLAAGVTLMFNMMGLVFMKPEEVEAELPAPKKIAPAPRRKRVGACDYCGRNPCGCGATGEPA